MKWDLVASVCKRKIEGGVSYLSLHIIIHFLILSKPPMFLSNCAFEKVYENMPLAQKKNIFKKHYASSTTTSQKSHASFNLNTLPHPTITAGNNHIICLHRKWVSKALLSKNNTATYNKSQLQKLVSCVICINWWNWHLLYLAHWTINKLWTKITESLWSTTSILHVFVCAWI